MIDLSLAKNKVHPCFLNITAQKDGSAMTVAASQMMHYTPCTYALNIRVVLSLTLEFDSHSTT